MWEGELCRWVCGVYSVCEGVGVCRVHVVRGVWRGVCTQSGWRVVACAVYGESEWGLVVSRCVCGAECRVCVRCMNKGVCRACGWSV